MMDIFEEMNLRIKVKNLSGKVASLEATLNETQKILSLYADEKFYQNRYDYQEGKKEIKAMKDKGLVARKFLQLLNTVKGKGK